MKIAIFSEKNRDAREGTLQMLTKYASKSPEVIFPVTEENQEFAVTVTALCTQVGIPTTAYADHDIRTADTTVYSEDPVKSVIYQLEKGDAVGIMWSDSEHDHLILHSVEDLALDVWDITEGLATIGAHSIESLTPEDLRNALLDSIDDMVDVLATYVAGLVLDSLGRAALEQLTEMLDKKDISPFDDEE